MIRDKHGRKLRTRWMSEFCGFCWGEAYIGVTRYFRRKVWGEKYWLFRGQIKIALREDDLPLLKEFQDKLGGHIYKAGKRRVKGSNGKTYEQHQNYQWIVTNHDELRRIVKILEKGMLPAKKKKSVKILKKFLKVAHKTGEKYSPEEWNYLEKLRQESIRATKCKES